MTSGHVCDELQLVHEGMLFVRKAMELLEVTGSELPPPLDEDEDA